MDLSRIKKEFHSTIKDLSYGQHIWTVFQDFCHCAAVALAQPFYQDEELEKRYMERIRVYAGKADKMAHLLALTVQALELSDQDFLGQMFMDMELGSKFAGQFFTPYHLCKMMSDMTFDTSIMENREYITLSEPAAGAGGMVLAFAETMKGKGFNPALRLYVQAVDVSKICFDMTYIQLSLAGIPAEVIHGNTLSRETYEIRKTPVHFIERWQNRLSRPREEKAAGNVIQFGPDQIKAFEEGKLFIA